MATTLPSISSEGQGTIELDAQMWKRAVNLVSALAHHKMPEPAYQERISRATALAMQRDQIRYQGEGIWRVPGGSEGYLVDQQAALCQCDDFVHQKAPRALCKHRLCVMIVRKASKLTPADLDKTLEQMLAEEEGGEQASAAAPGEPPRPQTMPPRSQPSQAQARFTKAQKSAAKLRMALAGPSGSGKTFTALTIASALGQRVALIDTEHGAASHYAEYFDFDTLTLTSFHPERYIEALDAAATEGYDVVIVDSLSHAWFGTDGELELVDRAAKRSQAKNTYFAWREVTPLHNKLVEALLQSPCHVLVTLRTKTEYVIETDGKGKQVPRKIGMAPIQRDGLEYEFDCVGDLDLQHTLVVTKSRLHTIADLVVERPDATFGTKIKQALS